MAHNLFARLMDDKAAEDEERGRAMAVYRRLLATDSDKPDDVKAFKRAVELLGKTPAHISVDLRTLGQARTLVSRVAAAKGIGAVRQAAAKAITDSVEEKQEWLRQWAARHQAKVSAASEVEQVFLNAQAAQRDLVELKRQHPEQLADVAAVAVED